jgi:hypothetical protein
MRSRQARVPGTATGVALIETGWSLPFSGPSGFEYLAPTEVTDASEVNQPIGQEAADEIAVQLGLRKSVTFTAQQYEELVSGGGVGGNAADANLINESIQILTNTSGRPLYTNVNGVSTPYVLGSYGLIVNADGLLESDANTDAPDQTSEYRARTWHLLSHVVQEQRRDAFPRRPLRFAVPA